jgi:nucleotidyltransferase substrate binding protein (TIGR01987 family)
MVEKRISDVRKATAQADSAVKLYQKEKDQRELNFLMVVKAYEILVELAWKYFKEKVEDEGLSAASPKESVRKAATIGLIDDPEKWIKFIDARNLSVHDYFGLDNESFLELTAELIRSAKKELKIND